MRRMTKAFLTLSFWAACTLTALWTGFAVGVAIEAVSGNNLAMFAGAVLNLSGCYWTYCFAAWACDTLDEARLVELRQKYLDKR